jgi:hypothetical protein
VRRATMVQLQFFQEQHHGILLHLVLP